MWPFSRKPAPISFDPNRSDWVNMKGEIEGLPAFMRLDAGLKKSAGHPDFGHEILVVIGFNSANENGLPSSKEDLTEVDELEERIKDHLESEQTAILALILTHGGVRQLYFYSSDPDRAIRQWEDNLRPQIETRSVEFFIRPEPKWEMYKLYI